MIRIYQKTKKSCFAACVASIIECKFEIVPHWFHAPKWDHWGQRKWLAERSWGMIEHKLLSDSMWQPTEGIFCILSGKSPRGSHDHAVVAITQYDTAEPFRVVHDPWVEEMDLKKPFDGDAKIVTYLIPMKQFKIK